MPKRSVHTIPVTPLAQQPLHSPPFNWELVTDAIF